MLSTYSSLYQLDDYWPKVVFCNCRSKLVSQLTNGQLNSKCDDTKAYVDLYRLHFGDIVVIHCHNLLCDADCPVFIIKFFFFFQNV